MKISRTAISPAPIGNRLSRRTRRALLVSKDFNDHRSYETVSRNHGHLLEVFALSKKPHDIGLAPGWEDNIMARVNVAPRAG